MPEVAPAAWPERREIIFITFHQTRPNPDQAIFSTYSQTQIKMILSYTSRVVTMVKINVYNRKYSDKFRIVNNTSG